MTTLHLLEVKRFMREKEALRKIAALDDREKKSLDRHCIEICNFEEAGACDYRYCKEAKQLMVKNALRGEKKYLSLVQMTKKRRDSRLRRCKAC